MLCVWEFLKRGQLLTKKLMLQGYDESRLKSSFRKFHGRYIIMTLFAITNYHWAIFWNQCITKINKMWNEFISGVNSLTFYSQTEEKSEFFLRRVCEMITLNDIRYNPATSTLWLVVGLALKSPHTHSMLLRIESTGRYTHHKQVIVVYYYIGRGSWRLQS